MMMDDDKCGTVGGMIAKGKSTRRKSAPLKLYSPQLAYDLI
jgi:hypothetical protein